ncbi:MATE family efflux transporter [bacterium]|nr:MATE family efflux transporter [bacterium]
MKAEVRTGRSRTSVSVPFHDTETELKATSRNDGMLTFSKVLIFSLPALGAVLADPLMSLVDTACVGQVSSIGLAALGPNTAVFGFVSMVFQFFSVSTTAMVSRAHSERNEIAQKIISQCVSDALSLALLCGSISTAVLLLFGRTILDMMYTPHELIRPALQYLHIRSVALPATLVTVVGTAASLGSRDSKTPLKVSVITGTLNVFINLYLVLGPPKMGIIGSAIGTCLSQYLGAVIFFTHMVDKRKGDNKLTIKLRFPNAQRSKPFVSSGAVLTTRSVCVMSSYSLATAASASMGTLTVAAHQVLMGIMTVAQFVPEPLSSCAQSNLASVGSTLGNNSNRKKQSKYAKNACMLLLVCGFSLGVLCALGVYLLLTYSSQIFSSDPHVVLATRAMAPLLSVSTLIYANVCVMDGLLFASGRMSFAAGTSIINLPIVAYWIGRASHGGFGLVGVWWSLLSIFAVRLVQNFSMVASDYGLVDNFLSGKKRDNPMRHRRRNLL